MYFLRLSKLRPAVEEIAAEAWKDIEVKNLLSVKEPTTNLD